MLQAKGRGLDTLGPTVKDSMTHASLAFDTAHPNHSGVAPEDSRVFGIEVYQIVRVQSSFGTVDRDDHVPAWHTLAE